MARTTMLSLGTLVLSCLALASGFRTSFQRVVPRGSRADRSQLSMITDEVLPDIISERFNKERERAGLFRLGGKVLVTGLGAVEEDEFMLNLLNEQNIWTQVLLATGLGDGDVVRKRFLSRTARYSGLLNLLEVQEADIMQEAQLSSVLKDANTWMAFNVAQESVPYLAKSALAAGVKRFVVTVALTPEQVNATAIPEFDAAVSDFTSAGGAFTGIRHGTIVEGDENEPYHIVNATSPIVASTVERGVLARVAAELLMVGEATNTQCGLSSSNYFSAAYLNILRRSGLTRRDEVKKVFLGGTDRVARMMETKYAEDFKAQEERAKAKAERKAREELEELQKKNVATTSISVFKKQEKVDPNGSLTNWDDEAEEQEETDEQKVTKRSEEILARVWFEYDTRMLAKSTSMSEFYDSNRPMARELALKELEEEKLKLVETDEEKAAKRLMLDRLMDVNRKQYDKLLLLERKEMQSQKEISDTWVKYVYLLLESTMRQCKETGALFHNMDQFEQTLLLREVANKLRADCSLPPYDKIYDALDASVIISKLTTSSIGQELGLGGDIETVMAALSAKYEPLLRSVPALRGAQQIVELAIETLKKSLPPAPPSVSQLKSAESKVLSDAISAGRLEKIKNRGMPAKDDDSGVGRM